MATKVFDNYHKRFKEYDQNSFRERRLGLGISVAEMAQMVGVSEREIYAIEAGKKVMESCKICYGIVLESLEN